MLSTVIVVFSVMYSQLASLILCLMFALGSSFVRTRWAISRLLLVSCMKRPFDWVADAEFREMEEAAAAEANTINVQSCELLGVAESFILEWTTGVALEGANNAEPYFLEDYQNLKNNASIAAEEFDRLSALHKIFWYPDSRAPSDLCVCSANIVLKGSRPRVVHDWTKAGLNPHLFIPEVNYGTMDSLLGLVFPGCYMAGLDFQDCFLHWLVHADSRRRLGVRHPTSGRLGVFLFLPFGLGPAPGINDRNITEVVRVVRDAVEDINVATFVDDLRLINRYDPNRSPEDDMALLSVKLWDFKETCESMGMRIHEKPGKLIWPTTAIEWIGWLIDSRAMLVIMTDAKAIKGLSLCKAFLDMLLSGTRPRAKHAMELWGFLNFVANIIRQAQPYTREIGRCIVDAKVFQAWSSGRRNYNPPVYFSDTAVKDLLWWVNLFQAKPHRRIHHVAGQSFIWHRKLPDLDKVRRLAWDAGLLLILGLDASSEVGWGITLGDEYVQGVWDDANKDKHINWKELKCYDFALDRLSHLLINRIVYIKSDNIAALHYINVGRGRIPELSDLARTIRLKEVQLGIESVAIHIPGVINVTPDALSRYYIHNEFRDKQPHRTLRKRLFLALEHRVGTFSLDGMVADDGHNKLVSQFCSPSEPFFEANLAGQRVWLFPPLELIGVLLKFVLNQAKVQDFCCCILVPERSSAHWYKLVPNFKRVERYAPGSDLFRILHEGTFIRAPKVKEYWLVLALNL